MNTPKTNAALFMPNFHGFRHASCSVRIKRFLRRLKRHVLAQEVDDYDWRTYHQYYGPQNEVEARNWTYDLSEIDFMVADGRIFTIADAKPLNSWHRVVFEALLNLPNITSIHEIGTGGGKLIVNLGKLLGPEVRLGASDIALGQLALFRSRWPAEFCAMDPFVHDITNAALPPAARADVVFAATVLMHIKRRDAYRAALGNLLASANKYLILLDNWAAHEYLEDIRRIYIAQDRSPEVLLALHIYDSGSAIAVVAALRGEPLPDCFQQLNHAEQLKKYG